jgi:hypothetical protein
MRGAMGIAIICCALFASGCSTVPSLQDASGESGKTGPLVTAVINSVKCEIGGALKKLNESEWRGNTWIRNWAVKADITLIVVNTAGIAPTVSYTKFFGNAFNFDAGSSSLTAKVIAPIQQFFTFGAGVNGVMILIRDILERYPGCAISAKPPVTSCGENWAWQSGWKRPLTQHYNLSAKEVWAISRP